MRRENRRHENAEDKDSFKSLMYFLSGVLGLGIITFVMTFSLYSNKLKNEEMESDLGATRVTDLVPSISSAESNNTTSVSTETGKTVEEAQNEINAAETNTETSNAQANVLQTPTPKPEPAKAEVKKELAFEKPVEGEIIFEYAMEKLIYSETLKEWITHPGIDIKAEQTAVVKTAEDGTVKAIKNDPRYGLTVIIEHRDGFTSVYSNLLTAEFITIGENLTKGQTIGTVGNTAVFESVADSHLHFEILKDNKNVDPGIYLIV